MTPFRPSRSGINTIALIVAAVVMIAGCSTNDGRDMSVPRDDQNDTITQTTVATTVDPTLDAVSEPSAFLTVSGSWEEGGTIDVKHTCAGAGVSPALSWTGASSGAKALGFTLSESDDPANLLWVVANIEPTVTGVAEGEPLPVTAVVAKNSRGVVGYTAPCPDTAQGRSYLVTMYALDQVIEAATGDDASTIVAAMESAALDATSTEFVATGA